MDQQLSNESLEAIFSRLKPYCVDLLDLLRNPKKRAPFLVDMADFLRCAPPQALQPSVEYTMFPLLLLLDAAVQCRAGERADEPMKNLDISDSVAEGVLLCIEELLKKCHLGSVNQMVVVLKKLTSGAMLSPNEASEEFREGIIRCLRAMLFRIQPCAVRSCTCKKQITLPKIITALEAQYSTPLKYYHEPDECLLAFLQSRDASAAVGHWLSLLLQIAETEVSRGHRGSSSLRMEALLTLRVLVAKIGSADALAFFLPGIVSRFSKALHLTKSMISGAAGSTGSIEHAVRGLSEFLMIVLHDEANLSGLETSGDPITELSLKSGSPESVLQALRCLAVPQSETLAEHPVHQMDAIFSSKETVTKNNNHANGGTLYVNRTKQWINKTSENVDKLLSVTFPHVCHPNFSICCFFTLVKINISTVMYKGVARKLQFYFEDKQTNAFAAHESLQSLFMSVKKFLKENEVSHLFTSLIERLPKVVLGSEETAAISHARRVLAFMYYAGPQLVVDHLFCSPIKAARFLECLRLSLSPSSQFSGPVDKLILSKPLSVGYLLSVAELKAGVLTGDASCGIGAVARPVSDLSVSEDKDSQHLLDNADTGYELPHMPPWFVNIGSEKLYTTVAGILRLSGLSIMAGNISDVSLSVIADILLEYLRKLVLELRMKDYNKEAWQVWYTQSGSGQLLRQTSSAVCMLNEIIYGLSDQSVNLYSQLFRTSEAEVENRQTRFICDDSTWKIHNKKDAMDHIIHCIGSILHEYLSPEVWDLPADQSSPLLQQDAEMSLSLHFFRDITMLHQEIYQGIGIFSMVLGPDFVSNGFMHSTLYLLLQNLICSSCQIRIASDAVLRVLACTSGHPSVGHLVVENADYIIDSLCRQLRHLDLNPHVPGVFAAILSYIGSAHEILPLLEEPMQAVSSELEVLGRHQHPHLTIPFLKAINEITKASRLESCKLTQKAESFYGYVKVEITDISEATDSRNNINLHLEHLEELLLQLNEMRRYRRIVGSLTGSCLKASIPLLSSLKESACLLALNIIEDVTISLSKVEEGYKHEKETKIAIEKAMQLASSTDLQEDMDIGDGEADENRLLPAMNKIWPYLILCMKNKVSVAVITRCISVLSRAVQISGGSFFIRRFHSDGSVIWKLLASSPFRRPTPSKGDKQILLPYRSAQSSEDAFAETSSLKMQIAILNMIGELSSNTKSAPAIEAALKKVAGLVVGIACSNVVGLRDASIKALSGLACIDPDLIWLLLADVYYSSKNKNMHRQQPPTSDLPEMSQLLPPLLSPKDYLYLQYGGESSGFDLDFSSVDFVFQKMQGGELT
ncbi:uncharacterized protein LOC109838460 [Asparagus officinalis]|uniref:uncharacterized protein LOC109838460 n=1 Tax=Asparagus officinalis TaxID=4686 RepID=UPI00098E66FA|nr:uncharacterized protein LOC109838460 [Asparagus officinalis]